MKNVEELENMAETLYELLEKDHEKIKDLLEKTIEKESAKDFTK